jgi:hypothetical protein
MAYLTATVTLHDGTTVTQRYPEIPAWAKDIPDWLKIDEDRTGATPDGWILHATASKRYTNKAKDLLA